MSDLPLNLGYIKTKPGIFKAISVAVGFLAMVLIASAHQGGIYYHPASCFRSVSGPCDSDGTNVNCQVYAKNKQVLQEFKEREKPKYPDARKSKQTPITKLTKQDLDLLDDVPGSCPYPWLVVLPMALIIITWLFTIIMLIIQLVADLNQKFPGFLKFDFILHFVYTCVMLISIILLVIFAIWALAEKYPCTQRLYDNKAKLLDLQSNFLKIPSGRSNSKHNRDDSSKGTIGFSENLRGSSRTLNSGTLYFYKDCAEETEATYKLGLLIAGLVFVIGTLVLYGLIIMMLNSQSKSGNPRAPTQRMGGPGPQQQQPYQTQFSSQSSFSPN